MSTPTRSYKLEDGFFLCLVILVTIAFAAVLEPFFAAVLWGVIVAILFWPIQQRIAAKMPERRTSAALITLLLIIAIVIIPAIFLAFALIQEAAHIYAQIQSGQIDFARMFSQMQAALPEWAHGMLRRFGLSNFDAARITVTRGLTSSFRTWAGQALLIGQGAFSFIIALGVMLYLAFFLLRDGDRLSKRFSEAAPLRPHQREALLSRFVIVIRATVKGSLVVAIVQGVLGGIIFWAVGIQGALLWGVLMGAFSLLPAIGAAIVWGPVALYLFATGAIWQAAVVVAAGAIIIGSVDNVLRPILVGRDTRIPDYVVLISTLGGIELFGFNGIVIGPVIAALFISTWNIFTQMRREGQIAD
ncbi:AI-2E family transporter [Sphingobium sp.]|uniref:AI-2E family transporter n=1 Tax=Sphingobium sp. TaxID=1912891 RepID=UPI003BB5B82B